MRRALQALIVALALAATAACGSGERAAAPPPPLPPGAIALAELPAQGLVVETKRGVRLIGLDGHVYARLAGFRRWPRNGGGTHDFALENLDFAGVSGQPRVIGPHDRWYSLDAANHRLLLLRTARIPLPGGAELVSHSKTYSDGGVGFRGFTVERGGRIVLPRDVELRLVLGRLVFTRGRLVDPATGESRPVPRGCIPVGTAAGDLYALCTVRRRNHPQQPQSQLRIFGADGSRRDLAKLPLASAWGALSPDGRYVAAQMPGGCGATYAALAPLTGGNARLVTGDPRIDMSDKGTPYSTILGWTEDSKLIAYVTGPSCEGRVKTGTYVIDPATLKRRLVVAADAVVWDPFPQE